MEVPILLINFFYKKISGVRIPDPFPQKKGSLNCVTL